jgi:AraC-like DNA-binding protein
MLADIDEPIDDVARASIVAFVADALCALETQRPRPRGPIDAEAVELVREYLDTHAADQTPASALEQIAGADRFTIARHFRRVYGTSPDRYRVLRRLGLARKAIESGEPLARAAADAGFADQSHMTRQFKRAYGLTPASWVKAVSAD